MDFRRFEITDDDAGRRVDRVVRRLLPEISLSTVYKLLRKGLIRLDGKRIAPDHRAETGNVLMIAEAIAGFQGAGGGLDDESGSDVVAVTGAMPEIPNGILPETLLETDDLLFINKPVGIPVHGDGGLDSLIPTSSRAERSLSFRTGPLHRLDRDTSGVIAFSRSLAGARWFSGGMRERDFGKYYLGIARGRLREAAEWRDMNGDGMEMATVALPLECSRDGAFSLVRYHILTGRKHQIRIQTSLRGHPLAGDRLYDRDASGHGHLSGMPDRLAGHTYFLHAWQIVLGEERLPGLPKTVRAPLPEAFAVAVATLFGDDARSLIERGDLTWGEHEKP
jgi:23S rRNA pseudouridine955/2504/2580 synthase